MLKEAFKKTLKHAFIFGVGKLTSRIVGLILVPIYTRFLIPSDFGILAIIIMVGSVANVCIDMGLSTAIFRYYFLFEDEQKRKEVIANVFYVILIAGMVLTALLISISESVSQVFLKTSIYAPYLILIFLTMYMRVLKNIPLSVMRAREQSIMYSLLSVADLVLGLALNIYFVVILKRGIMGILEAELIVSILTAPLYLLFIKKDIRWCISMRLIKKLLWFGLPLVPARLAALILTLSNRYFLTTYASLEDVGLYTLGQKIGLIINILLVQPFQLIWPTMMYSMSDRKEAGEYYSRILTYYLITVGGIALLMSIFSENIISLIATESYHDAYKVIPLLAFSYVAYGVYFIITVGVNLKEKTFYLPWIVGVSAAANMILNYLLIPRYGMMGAAVASFISYIILVLTNYIINQRFLKIKYDWRKIATLSLLFFVSLVIFSCSLIHIVGLKVIYSIGYILFIWLFILEKKERKLIIDSISVLTKRVGRYK